MDPGQMVVGAYFACLGALALLGVHRLYLVALYVARPAPGPAPEGPASWPLVTIQLPLFNELYVVDRLLESIAALDYPIDRLQVQVLDDSDDGTSRQVAASVAAIAGTGLDIVHLRRRDRAGFKAGALRAGLASARGELICIFDADFCPRPDFLRRMVPHFRDPELGMVQARWGHLNRDHSLLTRVQAMFLDAHFAVEQAARNRSGRFFNFNGTAGIWRRRAIDEAGGWENDTLTEDLDLSYRAQLAGWRFLYVNEPTAPAELPVSFAAFKSQQRRWTRGAVQTARKLLPRIWASDEPLRVKLEATFHLTANVAYPLMVMLSLLAFPAMALRRGLPGPDPLWLDLSILVGATGSVCVFFLVAQAAVGRSWIRALPLLPALMALGAGLAVSNTVAVLAGLTRRPGVFVRTPKYALEATDSSWRERSYRSPQGFVPVLEVVFALLLVGLTGTALFLGMIGGLPVLLLFLVGYVWVAAASVTEARARPAKAIRPATV